MKCGIGKVNAAAGTVELIPPSTRLCHQHRCSRGHRQLPENNGCCGEPTNCISWCMVWRRQYVRTDTRTSPRFEGNATLFDCAMSLDTPTAIHGGLICSGDKFITDRSELNDIKEKFHEGLAVDMESGAIAQICYIYKVPFISFHIISDTPGSDNHWEQYTNFFFFFLGDYSRPFLRGHSYLPFLITS